MNVTRAAVLGGPALVFICFAAISVDARAIVLSDAVAIGRRVSHVSPSGRTGAGSGSPTVGRHGFGGFVQPDPQATPARVWVNASSKVYHCPGSRYYGNTARGSFMLEPAARAAGNRPASGQTCGPLSEETASPPARAPAVGGVAAGVRVWVNSSSRVYQCPGARYYGNTVRGVYMTEVDAVAAGHRPAAGKPCAPGEATPQSAPRAAEAPAPTTGGNAIRVWVNTASHVYHCPGTRYYGTTKSGTYMSEADARRSGNRPAGGRTCR